MSFQSSEYLRPRSGPCSARLKAGTANSNACSPEGERYKRPIQYRKFLKLFLLLLFAFVFSATASARELKIEKFSAEVFVQSDSTLDVTETIDANFIGAWHGLFRTIPVEYVTPQGFNYTLFVKLVDVTDAAGRRLKVETSRQGHYLKWKIYIDDATDAQRRIQIHYQVRNGLKFFEDHDELYWNVTGDEWDVPIERRQCTDSIAGGGNRDPDHRIHGFIRLEGARRQEYSRRQHGERFHAEAAGIPRRPHGRGRLGQGVCERTERRRSGRSVF